MMFVRVSRLRALILALSLSAAAPVSAQEVVAPPTPLADALAREVRNLAVNPRDLRALIAAGDLSTQLADPAAALAFYGRASAVAPSDARILAGRAGALVLLERPGEALRLYDAAERQGLSMRPYAAQRGLAYDLTGQPGYAQRDYRIALAGSRDDETVRRLALSLGISGKSDEAMTLLDPLLRRSDRAAWRARSFILAMNGDVPGAEKIATSMVPGGAALGPFLRRLTVLPPADRAYAVHFGELTTTVARQNDARLAPVLAALPAEPAATPVRVAASSNDRSTREDRRRSKRQRREDERRRVALAATAPTPQPLPGGPIALPGRAPVPAAAATISAPSAPSYAPVEVANASTIRPTTQAGTVSRPAAPIASLASTSTRPASVSSPPVRPVVQVAAASPQTRAGAPSATFSQPGVLTSGVSAAAPAAPFPAGATPAALNTASPPGSAQAGSTPVRITTANTLTPVPAPPPSAPTPSAPTPSASQASSAPVRADAKVVTGDTSPAPRPITPVEVAPSAVASPNAPIAPPVVPRSTPDTPAPAASTTRPVQVAAVAPPPVRPSVLDSIVGSIAVPASELDVAPIEAPSPPSRQPEVREPETLESARVEASPIKSARALPPRPEPVKGEAKPTPKIEPKPDPRKAKADAAALAAKKAKDDAAKAKAEEAKVAARKEKAEPARWFVQVAGGARADDLDKDWKRLSAKAPAAFRGKSAYTTPLRATNRLLAGPFKSEGEARAFVNQLAKEGASAFTFQSEAGQKITKLGK